MRTTATRIEHDSMGEIEVPAGALWGAQTERARRNFTMSGLRQPAALIGALALVKAACARANARCAGLDTDVAAAIEAAALAVAAGSHAEQFPLDVFQTGSGTSTNMNANEVIGRLASAALGRPVHPNDDVNRCQSSNDVIPTALHVASLLAVEDEVLPALTHLAATIEARIAEVGDVVKTGRTHLMDAVPLTLGQELSGWQALVLAAADRLRSGLVRLRALAIGATAIGTGLNAPAGYGAQVASELGLLTGRPFSAAANGFAALGSQDALVELSGQVRAAAVSLTKIANDLRWMNSGPLAGLGEIRLPALQPGSSIMPAKVNPVIPEAVAMACAQIMANDLAVALGGQSGNFQLNVMLPLIGHNLLQSLSLLGRGARALADLAIEGFTVERERLGATLGRNPILATALNPVIGYERAAAIARLAAERGETVAEVAARETGLSPEVLGRLLDPRRLTGGGDGNGNGNGGSP
jgi:fumarate hydratase, class II